jgi:putative FmdB family regulatory protein
MPTYQYRCAKCGEQFEVWQSIHDDALTVHDSDCGGALLKVLGMGGIVLKGSGFYRTDNRSKSGGQDQERKRDGDGSKSDTSSGNGSGDSKKSESDSKKSDSGSKSAPSTSGASKSDSSKS